MFKILLGQMNSYSYQPKEVGFKIVKVFAKRDSFKSQIYIRLNFGYKEFSLTLLWGRCKKSPDFLTLPWKALDKIKCYNDEETILLRQDKEYTVREIRWKNGGDGFLYPKVSLMEFKPEFDYDAYHFLPQEEEVYE